MKEFPRITIKHEGDGYPIAKNIHVYLDGKEISNVVTDINFSAGVNHVTRVTLGFFAYVDVEELPVIIQAALREPEPELELEVVE